MGPERDVSTGPERDVSTATAEESKSRIRRAGGFFVWFLGVSIVVTTFVTLASTLDPIPALVSSLLVALAAGYVLVRTLFDRLDASAVDRADEQL